MRGCDIKGKNVSPIEYWQKMQRLMECLRAIAKYPTTILGIDDD
jgi:hypothetical protein